MFFVIPAVIFLIFFFIQKFVFTYAERMIFKFMPAIILFVILIFRYVFYRIERYLLFKSYAITAQIDGAAIMFTLAAAFILTALTGCLSGIAYIKLKSILKKTNLF